MITLSNNLSFNTIYSSGALGFDGNGWLWEKPLIKLGILPTNIPIITKTITYSPNIGKPFAVKFIKNGVKNQIGLHNKGFSHWIDNYYNKIGNKNIIVSISGNIIELMMMINFINTYQNIKGIEINISCPNVNQKLSNDEIIYLFGEIKSKHPLLLKINNLNNYLYLVSNKYVQRKVEAININSFATPNGGLSGKIVQESLWNIAWEIKKECNIPVIFSSCWDEIDVKRVKGYGADAVGLGSVVLRYPFRVRRIIES